MRVGVGGIVKKHGGSEWWFGESRRLIVCRVLLMDCKSQVTVTKEGRNGNGERKREMRLRAPLVWKRGARLRASLNQPERCTARCMRGQEQAGQAEAGREARSQGTRVA